MIEIFEYFSCLISKPPIMKHLLFKFIRMDVDEWRNVHFLHHQDANKFISTEIRHLTTRQRANDEHLSNIFFII
jgi:hypothetical protein